MANTRDMTDREFLAALRRNRFSKPVLFWCTDLDNPECSYSMLLSRKGKIFKRATIAHLLKSRERTEREKAEEAEAEIDNAVSAHVAAFERAEPCDPLRGERMDSADCGEC